MSKFLNGDTQADIETLSNTDIDALIAKAG